MSTSTRDHWRVIDAPIRFEVPVLAAGLAMQVTKRATEAVTQTISILEEEDNELNGLQKEAPVRATLLAFDGLEEAIACEIHGDLDMAESSARQREEA